MSAVKSHINPVQEELKLSVQQIRKMAVILRAVNHPLRQQILQALHRQPQMTVTELFIQLRLEQSVVSQHLAILRRAGFVKTHREGKFIRYSVNEPRLEQLEILVKTFLG